MGFQLPELPENISGVTYAIVGISAAIVVIAGLSRGPNLDTFPTVGFSILFSSWCGLKHTNNASDLIHEGYKKHKSAPFKVAVRYGWMVVLSDRKHLEELSRAPEDELSLGEAVNDQINVHYTLGHDIHYHPYHIGVIRSRLTRNIGTIYPEVRDEIVTAFDEVLDLKGDEWKNVSALDALRKVICRTTNRLLVGLPLCRNPDWIDLNIQCILNILKEGFAIGQFPQFLRSLAACLFTGVARDIKHGIKHLGPTIEERLKHMNEYENKWAEKPNDLLSWLMDEAEGPQLTVKSLVTRALTVNFFAINTASNIFTHTLFYLAANPQYIQPLRKEVEHIVEKEGWSKNSLSNMHKVDSFLRECQRLEGTNALGLIRKALKDFTFSDGTFIPKGTLVAAPAQSIHHDEKFYKNGDVFQLFRFADSDMQAEDGEGVKHQFVSTAIKYLPFGHGRHACAGRFFAASELKSMLAHIVVTYDIKLEDNATRPRSLRFGTGNMPDSRAKILFRRRVD